jgi:hypothetical protein
MKIHGITVCVDYAAELAVGMLRWWTYLTSLTIVTTARDTATIDLARQWAAGGPAAHLHVTDAFYRDGATFNKGRALEEARRDLIARADFAGWILLFDADVVPPADWADRCAGLAAGSLYGCRRFQGTPGALEDHGQPNLPHDVPGVGYFQLFHACDPVVVGADPLIDVHWTHAGNYDNRLLDRWRAVGRPAVNLPFRVAHLGTPGVDWCGKGNGATLEALRSERRRRGGTWDHERIGGPR